MATDSEFRKFDDALIAKLRGRIGNFNSEVSFDAQDETQSLFVATVPVPLSLDRLRIVRFATDQKENQGGLTWSVHARTDAHPLHAGFLH